MCQHPLQYEFGQMLIKCLKYSIIGVFALKFIFSAIFCALFLCAFLLISLKQVYVFSPLKCPKIVPRCPLGPCPLFPARQVQVSWYYTT